MTTRTEVLTRHRIDISLDDETAADLTVPVLAGMQRQGDVMIRPSDAGPSQGAARVPAEGVPLVIGEATGNTHLLAPDPDGRVWWRPAPQTWDGSTLLGTIHVEEGAAWLIHTDEHQVIGIAPGVYEARGKREQREEIERVCD